MPELEKELEKARVEWFTLFKERVVWDADAKNMKKLEADMAEIEKAMSQLQSIY